MDFEVATEHVAWDDLAKTFTGSTGKLTKYKSVTMEEHFDWLPLLAAQTKNSGTVQIKPTALSDIWRELHGLLEHV